MNPAIRIRDLTYAYPDGHRALFSVSLDVARGERIAILGPNGAGKTTLALHLNGIFLPQQGTVEVAGLALERSNLAQIRRRVGVVFQDPDDQLFMPSVREDVAFGPANLGRRGRELDADVAAALSAVRLEAYSERPPHHLSFGQKRRAALATILSMHPDIVVLDEPTSNLDPAGRRELADVLDGLDATIVVITHDLPYALQMCERSIVMDGGVIVADGATRDVLSNEGLMTAHRLELPYGFDPSFKLRSS